MLNLDLTVSPKKLSQVVDQEFIFPTSSGAEATMTGWSHRKGKGLILLTMDVAPGYPNDEIEDIITHETLHYVLYDFIDRETGHGLDKLCYPINHGGMGFGIVFQHFNNGELLR